MSVWMRTLIFKSACAGKVNLFAKFYNVTTDKGRFWKFIYEKCRKSKLKSAFSLGGHEIP